LTLGGRNVESRAGIVCNVVGLTAAGIASTLEVGHIRRGNRDRDAVCSEVNVERVANWVRVRDVNHRGVWAKRHRHHVVKCDTKRSTDTYR